MNWRFGICTLLYAFSASCGNVHLAVAVPLGADSGDENVISLVGTGCETVRDDETRSSVRIRATDKASFNAVEKIPELSGYRDSFSSHDFNVLVYNIIDNYIEDQAVRTTSQDDNRLCVEMTGYLNSENILKVLNDNFQKYAEPAVVSEDTLPNVRYSNEEYPDSLQIENKAASTLPAPILPPPPQPVISDKVAARPVADEPDLFADVAPETSFETVPAAVQSAKQPSKTVSRSNPSSPAAEENNIVYVFVDKTRFYNNTATLKFYQDLKQAVEERNGVKVTLDKEQAAYTVKTRVLRAKVDPINQQTSRLQMVIAAELEQPGKEAVVEHQNRFVLFDDKDDEQTVAANLMRKLLLQATRTVLKKVKTKQSRSDAIITPAETNYGVFAPILQP